jgi:hypothetical protein
MGEWSYSAIILDLGIHGGELSASRPGRFTTGERVPRCPLDKRQDEPQSRSGRYGEEKIVALPGIESQPSSV